MTDDVEMDAPQISTLREEETPEPAPNRNTSKFRVKLLVGEGKKPASASAASTPRKNPQGESDDDDDDDDEEEDQLIDDDDEEAKAPARIPTVSAPLSIEKKVTPAKRGGSTTGGRGRGRGRGRGASKAGRIDGAQPIAPTPSMESISTSAAASTSISGPPGTPKKRGGAGSRGTSTRGTRRGRGAKQTTALPIHLRDDAGSISEGTAASSPNPHDDHSPEFNDIPLPLPSMSLIVPPIAEDMNLEGVPLPSYPLPSRPFSVHPPQKIGTGFAPTIPLDKSGKHARHWRQANREVRGIAGGRWFVKSWVGDQDSEYSTAAAAVAAAMQAIAPDQGNISGLGPLPIPRLPGVTIPSRGRPRLPKPDLIGTTPSSRAQSIESISATIPKKRTNSQMQSETPTVSTPAA